MGLKSFNKKDLLHTEILKRKSRACLSRHRIDKLDVVLMTDFSAQAEEKRAASSTSVRTMQPVPPPS